MIKTYYTNNSSAKLDISSINLMKRVIKYTVEEEYPEHKFEVQLTVCDDEYIHTLNKQYRDKDKPTDVLSFPMLDFDTPEIMTLLGDIVISVDTAQRQADEAGHSLIREMCFLCIHSALHLLGYDHETSEEDEKYMYAKQDEILSLFFDTQHN